MTEEKKQEQQDPEQKQPEPLPDPVVRSHRINVGRKALSYTSTSGLMPISNDKGEEQARLFFTAYTLDGDHSPGERPLTIAFNGGPGSASVWLHLGGLGPKRIEMLDDGGMPVDLTLLDGPSLPVQQADTGAVPVQSGTVTIDDMQKEHILRILAQTKNNKSKAARLLGIKRTTLLARMKKLGLMP